MKTNHIEKKNLKKLCVPNSLKIGPIQSYVSFFNLDQSHDDALRRQFTLAFLVRLAYNPILGYEVNVSVHLQN